MDVTDYREGPIAGVVFRRLTRWEDDRGWLVEFFRHDELDPDDRPAMGYVSQSLPGVTRGPHEHRRQTDLFAFVGPGDFKLYLWDARGDSSTAGNKQAVVVGQSNMQAVTVPPGVVHAYRNLGETPGLVFNFPNRLYAGEARKNPVDDIRYEDRPDSPFVME